MTKEAQQETKKIDLKTATAPTPAAQKEMKEAAQKKPVKEAPKGNGETGSGDGSQTTLPGVEQSEEDNKPTKTWGEVRIMELKTGSFDGDGNMTTKPPASDNEPSWAFWMDLDVDFPSGSTKDAEQYLEKMLKDSDRKDGGKFMIIRRVKTIEAQVETIRRVQFFEE